MLTNIFNQIPYTCRILTLNGDGSFFLGSGAFVSPEHVLTAHHVIRHALQGAGDGHVTIVKSGIPFYQEVYLGDNVAKDRNLDVALIRLERPLSSSFLKVARDFDKDEPVRMASPGYWFTKKSRGRYLKPDYDHYPDENGTRPFSEFEFARMGKNGMSGSPIINDRGEIVSLYTAEVATIKRIRRFLPPIGNDVGITPRKLINFYERYRSHVEGFAPA